MALALAQADVVINKKERVRVVDGKVVKQMVSVQNPNQERIVDAVTMHFQEAVGAHINYFELERSAIAELELLFDKHHLDDVKKLTRQQRRIRNAAVRQVIDNYVLDSVKEPKIEISYDELIELTGIKSARNFAVNINNIRNVVGKSSRKVRTDEVDLETMEIISTHYREIVDIDEVDIVLEPEMAQHYPHIEDFLDAKKMPDGKAFRNKKKYVKKLVFSFSKKVIPYVIAQGREYVSLFPETRRAFNLQMTYNLDVYITSIQSAQHIPSLTDFTPEELQGKLGFDYADFSDFMRKQFEPAVKDFNAHDRRRLSYLIKRDGGPWEETSRRSTIPISKIRLRITGFEKTNRTGVEPLHYYIALQLIVSDDAGIFSTKSVKQVIEEIEPHLNSSLAELTALGSKTINEWLLEAKFELEQESKVLELLKVSDVSDIIYDEETMHIISTSIDLEDIDRPSDSYRFLTEQLGLEVMQAKKSKKRSAGRTFPHNDEAFVLSVLSTAKKSGFLNPMELYFSAWHYYASKGAKNKDWIKAMDNFMLKHDKKRNAEAELDLVLRYKDKESGREMIEKGRWLPLEDSIDTENSLIALKDERVASLLANGDLKQVGSI